MLGLAFLQFSTWASLYGYKVFPIVHLLVGEKYYLLHVVYHSLIARGW